MVVVVVVVIVVVAKEFVVEVFVLTESPFYEEVIDAFDKERDDYDFPLLAVDGFLLLVLNPVLRCRFG